MFIDSVFYLILLIATSAVESPIRFTEQDSNQVRIGQVQLQCKNDDSILSCDYLKAKKALLAAEERADFATIRTGLARDFSFELKMDILETIGRLGDKSFVEDLALSLENNQGTLSGGTETVVAQALLSRELIATIGKLTGLEFKLPGMPSSNSIEKFEPENYVTGSQIKEALRQTHIWLEKHNENASLYRKAQNVRV